ncbi:cytosolic protein [bacterium]|nr:cytosolic protein [bacterium]
MNQLKLNDVVSYVEENIYYFHQKRIEKLDELKLKRVLSRKNPYLFKAKYVLTSEQIIRGVVDAYLSSSEEGIFGDWLEGLALFINNKVYKGWKSGIPGIDLEFDKDNVRYIINIKSGPNWANKSQKEKMLAEFAEAKRTLATSGSNLNVVAVNGCCYGRNNNPHKFPKKGPDYFKYYGQVFWEFISGNPQLYTDIIEPLGHKAKERNDIFLESYAKMINKFTREFANYFCDDNGQINWLSLVQFNSGNEKPIL